MSDALNNEQREQLLIAYLDGELNAKDRATAEALLDAHPEYVELVDQWKENSNLFSAMPRYRLDNGFADRVLDAIDSNSNDINSTYASVFSTAATDSFASNGLAHKTPTSKIVPSAQASHRTGLALLAALAAMLLLSVFVFPAFVEEPVTALNNPSTTPGENVPSETVTPKTTGPENTEGKTKGYIPRNVLLNSRRNGSSIKSKTIDPLKLRSQNSGISQFLLIETESTKGALKQIETVFAKHDITYQQNEEEAQNASGFEAIHVVSTSDKMKKAIKELTENSDISVRSFAMPSAPVGESATAQRLDSTLISDQSQNPEIKEINKWFNLEDDKEEDSVVQFLLMLGTK